MAFVLWAACTCEPVLMRDGVAFNCSDDTQCSSGFVCLDGLCRPEGTQPDGGLDCRVSLAACDAGIDAGVLDAGDQSDAGTADAGFDAGSPDGGTLDAGPAWQTVDIGAFFTAGQVTYSGSVITAAVQNGDIWYDADDFFFLHQTRSGDIEVTARIDSIDAGAPYAKTGVMIRQHLTADSPNAFMALTAFEGNSFQVRDAGSQLTGPGKVGPANERAPYWVRLVRRDGQVRGYVSGDGGTFIELGVLPDPFTDPVYVGLAVASHDLDAGNVSVLSDVGIRTP